MAWTSMKPELFARVMVAVASDELEGTAYPIGAKTFLTAGHVVAQLPELLDLVFGNTEETHRVTVRRVWCKAGDPEFGEVDVAVLRYESGEAPPIEALTLARAVPTKRQAWESRGFPRATDRKDQWCNRDDIKGELPGGAVGDRRLPFNVHTACSPTHQAGFSGTPLISEGAIWGVLSGATLAYKGNKGFATPAALLWEDPTFIEAAGLLGGTLDEERVEETVKYIRRHCLGIFRDHHLGEQLEKRWPEEPFTRWWEAAKVEDPSRAAKGLFQSISRVTLGGLTRAFNQMHALLHADSDRSSDAGTIWGLYKTLAPLLATTQFGTDAGGGGGTAISIPTAGVYTAELFLAGKDGSEASYLVTGDCIHSPFEVHEPGQSGIDIDAELGFDELSTRLYREHMRGKRCGDSLSQDQLGELDDELEHYPTASLARRYYLVLRDGDSDWRNALKEKCASHLKNLRVVLLSSRTKAGNADEQMLRDLHDLIHRAHYGLERPLKQRTV